MLRPVTGLVRSRFSADPAADLLVRSESPPPKSFIKTTLPLTTFAYPVLRGFPSILLYQRILRGGGGVLSNEPRFLPISGIPAEDNFCVNSEQQVPVRLPFDYAQGRSGSRLRARTPA